MCGGFSYIYVDPATGQQVTRQVFFSIPHAQVPYVTPVGTKMAQWGRRKGEDLEIDVPVTGWARLSSLVAGKWNQYNPSRVRIPALSWMEKDVSRESHWFDMAAQSYLLGVKIEKAERSFVYVVTRDASPEFSVIHQREPMVVGPE